MCQEEIKTKIGGCNGLSLSPIKIYQLKEEVINRVVSEGIVYGNYRKGKFDGNYFHVVYVGRTDQEPLRNRLLTHARKHPNEGLYFSFSKAKSAKEAYEKECCDYHLFIGKGDKLANKIHPDRPDGTDYLCPICGKPDNNKEE